MDSIGAEVGHKMRSAIKAKLMELDCYVDDELPDYIMVMVANRRTKSQMNEDLNLFLSTKTSTFVNWLHIVLKKLKEVTVTNPEVYKKALKRKNTESPDDKSSLKVKKEKAHKKVKVESQSEKLEDEGKAGSSITDGLSTNKLSDNRKIIVNIDKEALLSDNNIADDNFDIPLLSEVNESINEKELQDIERKIRNVKSRLGLLVESDDNDEEAASVNPEHDKSVDVENESNTLANARQISILDNEIAGSEDRGAQKSLANALLQNKNIDELEKDGPCLAQETDNIDKRPQHKRITFENERLEPVSIKSRLDRPSPRPASRDRFSEKSRSPAKTSSQEKRPSILDRLGKRIGSPERSSRRSDFRQKDDKVSGRRRRSPSRDRPNRLSERLGADRRKRKDKSRERHRSKSRERSPLRSKDKNKEKEPSVKREVTLNRVGVQSKVEVIKKAVPAANSDEEEEETVVREVRSAIKVKPRVIASDVVQPNKNLLLKAMAEAQRSIAQTPKVGKDIAKPDGFFTKKYSSEKRSNVRQDQKEVVGARGPESGRNKLKTIIRQSSNRMRSWLHTSSDEYDSEGEYIPKPVKKVEKDVPNYIPSSKSGSETESRENDTKENGKQQFIITLDGIDKLGLVENSPLSVKSRVQTSTSKKRSPSPIVFDKTANSKTETKPSRPDIPDKLPIVHPPLSIKTKERCRYWPGCRQGDKCEFVHPSETCQMFPQCKFGDKCLFLHPKCKFSSSCTKRECPYDHNLSKTAAITSQLPAIENCKFFPNCANAKCPFYHAKPCKYGKFCKNIADCTFSHALVVNKKNMSWRSK